MGRRGELASATLSLRWGDHLSSILRMGGFWC